METPNLRKSKPISEAGRSRVEHALKQHGLVLTQGQWEIPSLADLLERLCVSLFDRKTRLRHHGRPRAGAIAPVAKVSQEAYVAPGGLQ